MDKKSKFLVIQEDKGKICRFNLIDNRYELYQFFFMLKKDTYEINENVFHKLKLLKISDVYSMSKIELFKKCNIEELLI